MMPFSGRHGAEAASQPRYSQGSGDNAKEIGHNLHFATLRPASRLASWEADRQLVRTNAVRRAKRNGCSARH